MVAFVALVALSVQSEPVTFRHRLAPVPIVLKALGKELGQELTADGAVAGRDLYVRVDDVSRSVLMARIAEATGGEWRSTPRGAELVPDRKRVAAAKEAARQERVAGLRERWAEFKLDQVTDVAAYDKALRDLTEAQHKDDRAALQVRQTSMNADPGSRLAYRLLVALGPELVADLSPRTRIVYALNPTRTQRPFPASFGAAFQAYSAERAAHEAVLARTSGLQATPDQPLTRPPGDFDPATTLFVLRPDPTFARASVIDLRSWRQDASVSMWPVWKPRVAAELAVGLPDTPVVLGEDSLLMEKCILPPVGGMSGEEKQRAWKSLQDPQRGFLGSPLSDSLDHLVENAGYDVVACLPSTYGASISRLINRAKTARELWMSLVGRAGFPFVVVKGVLTVGPIPRDLEESYSLRASDLDVLLGRATDGVFDLEDASVVTAATWGRTTMAEVQGFVSGLVGSHNPFSVVDPLADASLAFIGSLPDAARNSAKANGYVAKYSALTPKAAAALRTLVFDVVDILDTRVGAGSEPLPRANSEPTIALGDGIPADTSVRLKLGRRDGLVTVQEPSQGRFYVEATATQSAAYSVAWSEVATDASNRSLFLLTGVETLDLKLDFGQGRTLSISRQYVMQFDPDRRVPWTQLPEATRAEIERHLPEARKFAREHSTARPAGRIKP